MTTTPDRSPSPPPEPPEIGVCVGCGDPVLADEEHWDMGGKLLHYDQQCYIGWVNRMLGVADARMRKTEELIGGKHE